MDSRHLPGIPLEGDEPVFASPWQARTFAMAVQCHETGLFSWSEWAEELSQHIADFERNAPINSSDDYYTAWQSALEAMVARRS
ncbi:MAG: nitrile hydratase accessory protein [Pseudomonadota bacterium]